MTQYLLSVYQPDGAPPADVDLAEIMAEVETVNADMVAAGVWVFAGGLCPPSTATVIRGDVLTDGPFTEGKEHLGGFTIIEAPDLDTALDWGRRLTAATRLPVEVRPFAG
ncbi:MAG TPA: YciI family protein [Actinoplanes sp.]|nr:YciI family protein [Actinoplanes sp.]